MIRRQRASKNTNMNTTQTFNASRTHGSLARNTRAPSARRIAAITIAVIVATCGDVPAQTSVQKFVESIETRTDLPTEAREVIRRAWQDCGDDCDTQELLIQGLTLVSTEFRAGLDAYDSDDYARAAQIMNSLTADDDPFIAANAAAFEIKAYVQAERLLEALQAIERATTGPANLIQTHSYLGPEIAFLKGYCLLADVQYDKAAEALESFLTEHPEASQRLTVSAQQMLLELKGREPEKIGDVADLMTFCGRRLVLADAGEKVQTRQDRIVELLDQMIEQAEQNEKNSQSSSGSSSGDSGGKSPQNPMEQSTLPGGSGPSGRELGESRKASPGEMWGAMPPAERERVLQALRNSFPQQYRRLVEQYYEELARKP